MRFVNVILLLCALTMMSVAQAVISRQLPDDVVIYSFEWRPMHKTTSIGPRKVGDYAETDPLNPKNNTNRNGQKSEGAPSLSHHASIPDSVVRPAIRIFYGYESSVHIKNTGTKTITGIEWEHVFFSDKKKEKEIRRFSLRKEENIAPEEQKFIAKRLFIEKYSALSPKARQAVEITRIEYSDGSVWVPSDPSPVNSRQSNHRH